MKQRERLTFQLPEETLSELETWAREIDRPVGYVVRQIVTKGVQERRASVASAEAR